MRPMKPIFPKELQDNIASVTVTFDDGDVRTLSTRDGSGHHFFERFPVGDDDVQLRLDWQHLDSNGQPMLDADFIDRKTGNHRRLHGKRRQAHHTSSIPGAARRYEWEFDGSSRRFTVAVTWLASASEKADASVSCSADVSRGADRKP